MRAEQTTDAALLCADRLDAAHAEIERLRAEVASLRLTLGGRTFDAMVPEPIGCPTPGACVTVAEIGRLRSALLECAADLEDELRVCYGTPPHPVEERRFARDMETVEMARRLAHGG